MDRRSGSPSPNRNADRERDERLRRRHQLTSYRAIVAPAECRCALLGFIRLRRRNFPAVSSRGLAPPLERG
jgi:hypothetical protein